MSERPKFVYVTYIAASPEKVWQALTDPNVTEKYWFGFRVAANGKAGERMTATDPKGKVVHHDPIIESDPPRASVLRVAAALQGFAGRAAVAGDV